MRIVDENDFKAWLEARFQHVDTKFDELRRYFDVVAEQSRSEIQLLAESVATRFDQVTSRIDQLEDKVDRGFAETQAMIRFSHAELDRRLRTLEDTVANLQSRVERLESTVH